MTILNAKVFSDMTAIISIPPTLYEFDYSTSTTSFSTPPSKLGIFCLLYFNQSGIHIVVFHVGFNSVLMSQDFNSLTI